MGAVTVNLPKSRVAVFPARCIGCGADGPDTTWRVYTHAIGWWTVVFQGFGPRFSAEAPACRECRGRLRRGVAARIAMNWVLAFVGVGLAAWALGWQQGFWGKWMFIGLALLAFLPLLVWEHVFPPALDMTAYSETVDYDFRDAAYAEEFQKLNRVEAVSVEPSDAVDPGRS
jgi:hypothetical protein